MENMSFMEYLTGISLVVVGTGLVIYIVYQYDRVYKTAIELSESADILAEALNELISGSDCDGDCKSCGFPNNRSCAEGNARKVLNDYKRKHEVEG